MAEAELKVDETSSGPLEWVCDCGFTNTGPKCIACFAPIKVSEEIVLPKTMKCLIKETDGEGFVYKSVPVPVPAEDEVLIRAVSAGVCGSDLLLYKWGDAARKIATLPFTPGHEVAGIVVKKGDGVRMKLGQRVAVENHFYCDDCAMCTADPRRRDICLKLGQLGHGRGSAQGGLSEYFTCKAKYCYRLRTDISFRDAALLEPLGVAHNACERVKLAKSRDLVVTGCGTIGLYAIAVAKNSMKCPKVIAVDVVDWKLKLAKEMGADVVINPTELADGKTLRDAIFAETEGIGASRMIEASGNMTIVNECFGYLCKDARIVMVGLPKKPLCVENPMSDIIFKSLTIKTIHGRRIWHTWTSCELLVSEGVVDAGKVVTHEYDLEKFEEGFETLMAGKDACKVMFKFD